MHELCKLLWSAVSYLKIGINCEKKKEKDNWGIWTLLTVGVSIIFHDVKELQAFFFFLVWLGYACLKKGVC